MVRELLKAKPSVIDVVTKDNYSALYIASHQGHLDVVRELIKTKPSAANISALSSAFAKGQLDVVTLLFDGMALTSTTMTMPDHPQHPLVVTPPDGRRGYTSPQFDCHLCKASVSGPSFHCEKCKFDVCAKCSLLYGTKRHSE